MRSWKKVAGVFLFNLVVVWAVMEVVLRTPQFDYLKTYPEKISNIYINAFEARPINTYNTMECNHCITFHTPDFEYEHCYNNEGLHDVDHKVQKPAKTKRYLAFGDSFTEGFGAPPDSTWWKLLEDKLNTYRHDSLYHEVIGAGSQGSDLVYCYRLLRDKLIKYNPDVVFYCLNATDITEIALRGGMERFVAGNKINYRMESPWWEPLYKHSFVLRAWVHQVLKYDFYFQSPKTQEESNRYGIDQICQMAGSINRYCAERKIHFVLIIQPLSSQLKSNFNMLTEVDSYCQKSSIPTINLFNSYSNYPADSLPLMVNKYYWPIDGHCTPSGYNFMAGEIFKHAGEW